MSRASFLKIKGRRNEGRRRHLTGFTIVETVVALGIFAMAVTSILGVFLSILRIDQKSRAIRAVEQNARFLSEFISREGRNGEINYAAYGCPSNCGHIPSSPSGITDLFLINASGEVERIYLSGTAVRLEKSGFNTALTGPEVTVSDLKFYIGPLADPWSGGATQQQPQAVYTLTIESNTGSVRPQDQAEMTVEGMFNTRLYPRS